MTDKKTTTTTAETKTETAASAQTAPEPIDFSAKIGANLNIKNAEAIFGKANAEKAVRAVAAAGGYGEISSRQLEDGLAMPSGDSAQMAALSAKINTALNQLK